MIKKLLTSLALSTAWTLSTAQTPTSNVRLVKDINVGTPSTFTDSYILGNLEDTLLLAVKTEENGYWELWRSDGTADGTYLLVATTATWSIPFDAYLPTGKGYSIVLIDDQLYSTNGTVAGTKVLDDNFWGNNLVWKNDKVYYEYFGSIMSFNPVDKTTTTLFDTGNSSVGDFFVDGNDLYYTAPNSEDDDVSYLYKYGNDDTTALLRIDNAYVRGPWQFSKLPNGIIVFYFHGQGGYSLCATNGTVAGSAVLKVFNSGFGTGLEGCHTYGGKYYFSAINTVEGEVKGIELFASDGTVAGTQSLSSATNMAGIPYDITYYKGNVYFSAIYDGFYHHVFKTDGTPAGTSSVIQSPISNMSGYHLVSNAEYLYFIGVDENRRNLGQEIWTSTGSVAGSTLYETVAGEDDLIVDGLYATPNKVFFNGYTTELGRELYEYKPMLVGMSDQVDNHTFRWLPNPSEERISFSNSTENPEQVYLVDLLGQRIDVAMQGDRSIMLSHIQAGNYILCYTLAGKTYRNMITKK